MAASDSISFDWANAVIGLNEEREVATFKCLINPRIQKIKDPLKQP